MSPKLRLIVLAVIGLGLAVLSSPKAVWAVPGGQGTVPACAGLTESSQPPANTTVTLNTCTGLANIPAGAFPTGGRATVKEVLNTDLAAIGPLPRGLNFLGSGLTLAIFEADGKPVKFFRKSVEVCFPEAPNTRTLIRMWDPKFNRWIPFPTFRKDGLVCTRTRLPGTYAPVGR